MDLGALSSNLGLEEEEFVELVVLFLKTAKNDLHNLNEAYLTRDTEKAIESAHSLKGASGNLGFTELSKISNTAEEKAREEDLALFGELIESMRKQIAEIEACPEHIRICQRNSVWTSTPVPGISSAASARRTNPPW